MKNNTKNIYESLTPTERLAELNRVLTAEWSRFLDKSNFARAVLSAPVDPALYVAYMTQTYYYTAHNARNQALVGVRSFGVSPHYTKFCFEHAEEETGHELMALHDVKSMGIDVSEKNLLPLLPETEVLISYLYWISAFGNPLQRLGYSFWAENVYGPIGALIAKIKTDLKLERSQMTFFIAHSDIDQDHAKEVERMILGQCKTAQDWLDIEKVMLTSLRLTLEMTEGVLRQYQAGRA